MGGQTKPRLYTFSLSHPGRAARLALEAKGLDYDVSELLPGLHSAQLRLLRFRGGTVPALKLDGRRVQGSRAITRALDAQVPAPALFPADPVDRQAVEAAEAWGEQELQPVPRRLFRWGIVRSNALRRWLAADVVGLPAPRIMAVGYVPLAHWFARAVGADDDQVRRDLAALPAQLDRLDALIADGTLGGPAPNAADCQIAPSVRVLLAFDELRPLIEDRPAAALARRFVPQYPEPVRLGLPAAWLPSG